MSKHVINKVAKLYNRDENTEREKKYISHANIYLTDTKNNYIFITKINEYHRPCQRLLLY